MNIKGWLKNTVQKVTGLTIYKTVPFGVDPFYDIKQRLPAYDFKTFLDVGANVGQTAKHIREAFPVATIHSIEPIQKTFDLLRFNTAGLNVKVHNHALGARNEIISIKIDEGNENSSINSLVKDNNEITTGNTVMEDIQVLTVTEFCNLQKIERVDYLKIDTEGFDLEVIKGASAMLENHKVSFIEAEVSMNPGNNFHVSFEEVKKYLEEKKYFLFGIYEQVHEWKPKTHVLRRSNVLFISEKLIK